MYTLDIGANCCQNYNPVCDLNCATYKLVSEFYEREEDANAEIERLTRMNDECDLSLQQTRTEINNNREYITRLLGENGELHNKINAQHQFLCQMDVQRRQDIEILGWTSSRFALLLETIRVLCQPEHPEIITPYIATGSTEAERNIIDDIEHRLLKKIARDEDEIVKLRAELQAKVVIVKSEEREGPPTIHGVSLGALDGELWKDKDQCAGGVPAIALINPRKRGRSEGHNDGRSKRRRTGSNRKRKSVQMETEKAK